MSSIVFDAGNLSSFVSPEELDAALVRDGNLAARALDPARHGNALGWVDPRHVADNALVERITLKADEVRSNGEVFVLIGVGGSNQGSRAVIEAIGDGGIEVVYAGNTLSPHSLSDVMSAVAGRSAYVNVIAKNFETLEPGAVFRVIRHHMEKTYGEAEAARRIIATGSLNNSTLEALGREKGYDLLPFPLDVGGRFSVLSAVGLFPIAVAGVDVARMVEGAVAMKEWLDRSPPDENPAVQYALYRNLLLQKGFAIEVLAFFEPLLGFLSKWWVQLFGESEGKDQTGIFPSACCYSEDLHSLGQYIQDGRRIVFETFLDIEEKGVSWQVPHEAGDADGFAYVDGCEFSDLNRAAFDATVDAHRDGGVPCMRITVPELSAYFFGELFYFFQYACAVSATILGVNPYDQPGVEAYKQNMFRTLGRGARR